MLTITITSDDRETKPIIWYLKAPPVSQEELKDTADTIVNAISRDLIHLS